jgi:hypothetical protein
VAESLFDTVGVTLRVDVIVAVSSMVNDDDGDSERVQDGELLPDGVSDLEGLTLMLQLGVTVAVGDDEVVGVRLSVGVTEEDAVPVAVELSELVMLDDRLSTADALALQERLTDSDDDPDLEVDADHSRVSDEVPDAERETSTESEKDALTLNNDDSDPLSDIVYDSASESDRETDDDRLRISDTEKVRVDDPSTVALPDSVRDSDGVPLMLSECVSVGETVIDLDVVVVPVLDVDSDWLLVREMDFFVAERTPVPVGSRVLVSAIVIDTVVESEIDNEAEPLRLTEDERLAETVLDADKEALPVGVSLTEALRDSDGDWLTELLTVGLQLC